VAQADPVHIKVSRSRGLTIEWADGRRSEYGLDYLRERCPCATCTGAHGGEPAPKKEENPLQLYRPKLKIEAIEPVGNYAIQIRWNDGHDTGIYTWEYLRSISPDEAV